MLSDAMLPERRSAWMPTRVTAFVRRWTMRARDKIEMLEQPTPARGLDARAGVQC